MILPKILLTLTIVKTWLIFLRACLAFHCKCFTVNWYVLVGQLSDESIKRSVVVWLKLYNCIQILGFCSRHVPLTHFMKSPFDVTCAFVSLWKTACSALEHFCFILNAARTKTVWLSIYHLRESCSMVLLFVFTGCPYHHYSPPYRMHIWHAAKPRPPCVIHLC